MITDTILAIVTDEGGRTATGVVPIGVQLMALGGTPNLAINKLIDFKPASVTSGFNPLISSVALITNKLGQVEVALTPTAGQDGSTNRAEVELTFVREDGTPQKVVVPVVIYQPLLTSVEDPFYGSTYGSNGAGNGTPVFNPQTGLYEQKVRVINQTPFPFEGVRIYVSDLPAKVRLWNTTGSDAKGVYLDFTAIPVQPDGAQVITLEYFNGTFQPFKPTLALQVLHDIQPPVEPEISGNPVKAAAYRGYTPDQRAKFYIQFPTTVGRVYVIQYADGLQLNAQPVWHSSPVRITGNGNTMQWMDDGAPSTRSLPFTDATRIYRVVEPNP